MLYQRPPPFCGGRTNPSAAGNYRSRRKLASEGSFDPYAILNEDKGVTVVEQRTQEIWSGYHVREAPANRSIFNGRGR